MLNYRTAELSVAWKSCAISKHVEVKLPVYDIELLGALSVSQEEPVKLRRVRPSIHPYVLIRGGAAVGWDIAPQDGRHRFRFPMGALEFFKWPNPSAAFTSPGDHSVANMNDCQGIFLGVKCGRLVELTSLPSWLSECQSKDGSSTCTTFLWVCLTFYGRALPLFLLSLVGVFSPVLCAV